GDPAETPAQLRQARSRPREIKKGKKYADEIKHRDDREKKKGSKPITQGNGVGETPGDVM
ncbi:992_t:CDS:2, partial [Funneliformis geosporum]